MFFTILVVFFLLIAAVVAFLFSSFGEQLIKSKIEELGTQSLPSNVKIENIQLDFFKQALSIRGLVLSHPKGGENYTTPHMLRISSLDLQFDLTKLTSKEFRILHASVVSSDVFFEGGLLTNNLQTFLSQLSGDEEKEEPKKEETRDFDFAQATSEPEKKPEPKENKAGNDGFHLVIDKLEVKDSGVSFKLSGVPDFISEKTQGLRFGAPDYITSIGGNTEQATQEMSQNYVSHVLSAVSTYLEGLATSIPETIIDGVIGSFLGDDDKEKGEGDDIKEEIVSGVIGSFLGNDDEKREGGEEEGVSGLIGDFLGNDDKKEDEKKEEEGVGGLIGDFLGNDDEKKDDEKKEEEGVGGLLGSFVEDAVDSGDAGDLLKGATSFF